MGVQCVICVCVCAVCVICVSVLFVFVYMQCLMCVCVCSAHLVKQRFTVIYLVYNHEYYNVNVLYCVGFMLNCNILWLLVAEKRSINGRIRLRLLHYRCPLISLLTCNA